MADESRGETAGGQSGAGMKGGLLVLLLLLLPTSGSAQTNTAWPEKDRPLANALSNIAVGVNIGVDLIETFRLAYERQEMKQAAGCLTLEYLGANGIDLLLKHFVHETRPDGSDRMSFPSQHTTNAFVATGWAWGVSIPIAVGTGYLRTAANRHWTKDWLAGGGIGFGVRFGVTRLPACRAY